MPAVTLKVTNFSFLNNAAGIIYSHKKALIINSKLTNKFTSPTLPGCLTPKHEITTIFYLLWAVIGNHAGQNRVLSGCLEPGNHQRPEVNVKVCRPFLFNLKSSEKTKKRVSNDFKVCSTLPYSKTGATYT